MAAAEGSYGIHLNYVPYLLLHTPVLGWLKGAVLVALICWLFPGKPHPPRDLAPLPPMSRDRETSGVAAGGGPLAMGDRELARASARRGPAWRRL
ncbi:di- and tricarboxylate transporter [Klebsiella pneumoniae]|uniref:Di- and tricarboxylate transporter n=1 Tax=Klebsiella pneumoniae TaxID=573 RepID=A0A2X3DAR3_KLEPN|nr:di- and tricarboxylate transporter [Klebsiella pneumoniae]